MTASEIAHLNTICAKNGISITQAITMATILHLCAKNGYDGTWSKYGPTMAEISDHMQVSMPTVHGRIYGSPGFFRRKKCAPKDPIRCNLTEEAVQFFQKIQKKTTN